MNYQIITDKNELEAFINWLPELKPSEKFYCCLFARSKYTKDADGNNQIAHIKSDKAQLKRFVCTKDNIYWKIKQLEVEVGAYRQRDIAIPQESLALYISPNPRDLYKASINTMVKIAHCIRDQNILMNPHQEALSEIQKTKSRTIYVDFDIDIDEKGDKMEHKITEYMLKVKTFVNTEAVTFLRTRGGLHVLIEPSKLINPNTFYRDMKSLGGIDQIGDQLIPVPGTYQGGFTPYLFK